MSLSDWMSAMGWIIIPVNLAEVFFEDRNQCAMKFEFKACHSKCV